mmetsp:Transcript_24514/g.58280  ORF Transcript_24514/g.58280 Transcript_24514/m.58280 type:complete len:117 (+) Transcript_24514:308-658(+)
MSAAHTGSRRGRPRGAGSWAALQVVTAVPQSTRWSQEAAQGGSERENEREGAERRHQRVLPREAGGNMGWRMGPRGRIGRPAGVGGGEASAAADSPGGATSELLDHVEAVLEGDDV